MVARATKLSREESLRLLSSVPLGRVAFTKRALPTVRPVNHIVDDGQVILRFPDGAGMLAPGSNGAGVVVAYQADAIDPATHLGWSVIVTGMARLVDDLIQADRYRSMLQPWVNGDDDYVIRVSAELVSGIRLVDAARPGARLAASS